MAAPSPRIAEVSIVPHTHWDREWYAPFQTYRLALVHLVDGLLDLMESDPSYTRFLLDGQTALIDDYLEVRPDAASRIERLVRAGRLQVGPWMVLMDEFMVSGETIVRDLQLGVTRTRELGGDATVGYLPDMFGHVGQMPQLLRLAGIEHAVVWRGVPAAIDRTAFWWVAPDGSRVRAEYLYGSYANGRDLPPDPALLDARARGYEAELGPAALPGGALLLMNGSDHLLPQPHLGALVAAANAASDTHHFTIRSLAEHVTTQPVDALPSWPGELRSGARANVLMGVASNRVDVHQLCAAAERSLERSAEPLTALFVSPEQYPHALLDIGWRNLVLNSAHDSACACSHDEVVEAVRVRYQEARHVGDALATDALHALACSVDAPEGAFVVANPTARARGGMITVRVPGVGPLHLRSVDDDVLVATQVVREIAGTGLDTMVTGTKVRWVVEMMRGPELAGARIARVERTDRDDGVVEFTFHDAGPGDPVVDLERTRDDVLALGDTGATVAIRQIRAPAREAVAVVPEVPGFGWRTFLPVDGALPVTPSKLREPVPELATASRNFEGVVAAERVIDNGLVRAEVDPVDGTLTIEADGVRIAGANRYVDGGDGGDTYNYSPPRDDLIVDRPEAVAIEVADVGPVSARLVVTSRYRWPARAIGDERSCAARSDDLVDAEIRTTFELRAGERFLRVRVDLDNSAQRPPPARTLPVARARRRLRRRLRVLGRAPRPHGGRWSTRTRAPHVRVTSLRRLRRDSRPRTGTARPRAPSRRSARVRGARRRHRARPHHVAGHGLPLPFRTLLSPQPCRPAPRPRRTAAPAPAHAEVRGVAPSRRLERRVRARCGRRLPRRARTGPRRATCRQLRRPPLDHSSWPGRPRPHRRRGTCVRRPARRCHWRADGAAHESVAHPTDRVRRRRRRRGDPGRRR